MAEVLCLFGAPEIAARVGRLGGEIRERLGSGPLTLVAILKGAALFAADLARALGGETDLAFVRARSYGAGVTSSGNIVLGEIEREEFAGRRLLVVDTILDTGRTLRTVVDHLGGAGAEAIFTCVLLDKPARRSVGIRADWVGFTAPDRFLVGYGLDLGGRYRTLPYVGTADE